MNMEENKVFTVAEDGKPITFDFIFKALFVPLCFFAEGLLKDEEEAKDKVADCFWKFWQVREKFEHMSDIKAYLFKMVRNACFDYLRKNKTKDKYEDFILYEQRFSEKNIELLGHESELINQIYLEIEKLPPNCKEVFKLTYLEGLPIDEVAAMLNVTTSTVYNQRAKAIKALRTALSDKDLIALLLILSARIFNN